ncbi:LuxR C-terminal-related transcriptional regulator [Litoribacter ruber]|uniref:LuxR C-terminal-related transcriptional regulator n=1 Tax=Litoribacter ruber TaxID=702568 RepID=UPI001FE97DD7|nr:LuxR C-terminal-related transcriptional regulator [Litoribacter ruber]
MIKEIKDMHSVWQSLIKDDRQVTTLPSMNFDELISSIFSLGPFYFYILDFYDMSVSNFSNGFEEAHGIDPKDVKHINQVLALTHPDDMEFVVKAEDRASKFIYETIGSEHIKSYKVSYNFRFKTKKGSYEMFNHQSLILSVDEKGNLGKSLNIHTNIHHLGRKNNYKLSLLGLDGAPSYMNLDVLGGTDENECSKSFLLFSSREMEVIKLVAAGLQSLHIADKLNISPETVKSHRKNILSKSGCKNFKELVSQGVKEGWL